MAFPATLLNIQVWLFYDGVYNNITTDVRSGEEEKE